MKISVVLSVLVAGTRAFAPHFVGNRANLIAHRPSTTAFLFGRGRQDNGDGDNTAVLEKTEEEMMKLNGDAQETAVAQTQEVATTESSKEEPEKELSETENLLAKIKDAGTAGVISYALWELGFWAISLPVVILGYKTAVGHWPDFQDSEDMAKLGAEAFAFVNFARFAVPLRIGLALSTTPWIQDNIVDKFFNKKEGDEAE